MRDVSHTFMMNQKEGIDDIEFENFISNSIACFYSGIEGTDGREDVSTVVDLDATT